MTPRKGLSQSAVRKAKREAYTCPEADIRGYRTTCTGKKIPIHKSVKAYRERNRKALERVKAALEAAKTTEVKEQELSTAMADLFA